MSTCPKNTYIYRQGTTPSSCKPIHSKNRIFSYTEYKNYGYVPKDKILDTEVSTHCLSDIENFKTIPSM